MRFLTLLILIPFCLVAQEKIKLDSVPDIQSISISCFAVKMADTTVVKENREWYYPDLYNETTTFDTDGNTLSVSLFSNSFKPTSVRFYLLNELNAAEKIIDSVYVNQKKSLNSVKTLYYDGKGFPYKDSTFNAKGEVLEHSINVKDYASNVTFEKRMNADGSIKEMVATFYDKNGEITKIEYRDASNQVQLKQLYSWDEDQNVKSEYSIQNEDTLNYTITTFNEEGLPIQQSKFQANQSETVKDYTFEYEYDDYGFWYRKYVYQDGELTHLVERIFTYYE